MSPTLSSLIREHNKLMAQLELDKQPPSATHEKYLQALKNEKLMKRWHDLAQFPNASRGCQFWQGPAELFAKSHQTEVRYDPHKILLQLIAGPDVRPERVVPTCSEKKCFNTSHYSVLSLGELNDANFKSQIEVGFDEAGCIEWRGPKMFTELKKWSSFPINPQKYLFTRVYDDWRLQRLAFMTCSNSLCVNRAHVDRRLTEEEVSERKTVELLQAVFSIIDRPGLSKEMELGCVELNDEDLTELEGLVASEAGRYRPISSNESDWIFRVAWHCLAAVCWANFRFFALPKAFRNLGEVSLSVRKTLECPQSARCFTPSHRRDHLRKAFKNTSNPRYRNSNNENVLKHSIGLTEDTLLQSLATQVPEKPLG